MFCYLKYAEKDNLSQANSLPNAKGSTDNWSTKSKVDNKTLLFNPNCGIQILLDYIYEELKIDKELKIDFANESGQLMNIGSLKEYESALLLLQPKETYVLAFYDKNEQDEYIKVQPILNRISKKDSELITKLQKLVPSSRKSKIK